MAVIVCIVIVSLVISASAMPVGRVAPVAVLLAVFRLAASCACASCAGFLLLAAAVGHRVAGAAEFFELPCVSSGGGGCSGPWQLSSTQCAGGLGGGKPGPPTTAA